MSLHYGEPQVAIGIAFLVIFLILVSVFVVGLSLFDLPYASGGSHRLLVKVRGGRFFGTSQPSSPSSPPTASR